MNSRSFEFFLLLLLLSILSCHDNRIDPENFATAKLDGYEWEAQVETKNADRFGEPAINIFISSPNLINPKESIGFLHVPLKVNEYEVVEVLHAWDSLTVLGYFNPIDNHAPFLFFSPDENASNKLTIESFNEVTGELELSFEVTFISPSQHRTVVFSEGKIRTVVP